MTDHELHALLDADRDIPEVPAAAKSRLDARLRASMTWKTPVASIADARSRRRRWVPAAIAAGALAIAAAVAFAVIPRGAGRDERTAQAPPETTAPVDTALGARPRLGAPDPARSADRGLDVRIVFALDTARMSEADAIAALTGVLDSGGITGARVAAAGGKLVVELRGARKADVHRIVELATPAGTLRVQQVDHGSEYMRRLGRIVRDDAAATGIDVEVDLWEHHDSGIHAEDVYLRAGDCDTLRNYLKRTFADRPEVHPERDHELAFEPLSERACRSYYLVRETVLDDADVRTAEVIVDRDSGQAQVLVGLTDDGAARFGEVTARAVGAKLAIRIGDEVHMAPVVQSAITGGQVVITFANEADATATADSLARSLRDAPRSPPLTLETINELGD